MGDYRQARGTHIKVRRPHKRLNVDRRVFSTPSDMFCLGVQLYRSLGIRVMLVGLEIWTYGDQIEVSPDPNITLERFMAWRQQTLLPRIKHDNAQFIT